MPQNQNKTIKEEINGDIFIKRVISEIMRLNTKYIKGESPFAWLMMEGEMPTKILTPKEEYHRRVGAMTALNKIYNFILNEARKQEYNIAIEDINQKQAKWVKENL